MAGLVPAFAYVAQGVGRTGTVASPNVSANLSSPFGVKLTARDAVAPRPFQGEDRSSIAAPSAPARWLRRTLQSRQALHIGRFARRRLRRDRRRTRRRTSRPCASTPSSASSYSEHLPLVRWSNIARRNRRRDGRSTPAPAASAGSFGRCGRGDARRGGEAGQASSACATSESWRGGNSGAGPASRAR